MPKLSQLTKTDQNPEAVYSIEIDCEALDPPTGLTKAGILWAGENGQLSNDVIDAIVSFSLSGVEVTLEIAPSEAALEIDADKLLAMASNAGCAISVLPGSDEDQKIWETLCERFSTAFFHTPGLMHPVHPVSSYMEYLVAERVAHVDSLTPSDPYIREVFHDRVSMDRSNACKSKMYAAIADVVGGQEALGDMIDDLIRSIRTESMDILIRQAEQSSR